MLRNKNWREGWLTAFWGRESRGAPKDLIFASPCRPDGHLLHGVFDVLKFSSGLSLIEELESRGYDIKTLQFSIKRKYRPNERPTENQV